jgi:hypothetical protein
MGGMTRMLHLVNGDSVGGTLAAPHMAIWRDVLCEGPVPRTTDDAEFVRVRSGYLGSETRAEMEAWLAEVARYPEFDEVVIWCEHDLFDQVVLLRVLEWFGRRPLGETILSLIDAGTLLGRFTHEELMALLPARREVTPAQFELAREAWDAYTAEDPRGIVELLRRDTSALPFLHGALRRHLEEFPSAETGLSRTEATAQRIYGERGPMDWRRLFVAVQNEEERPFMGDTSFQRIWDELQRGDKPERWLGGARADRWRWDGEEIRAA